MTIKGFFYCWFWLTLNTSLVRRSQLIGHNESTTIQGRSHQVWSGQVSSGCVSTQQVGGSGGMQTRSYEIDHFWVKTMLLGGQTTEHEYLPVAPRIVLVTAFWLFANLKPHPSQMRLARLIVCFEEQKVAGRFGKVSSALFAAISY